MKVLVLGAGMYVTGKGGGNGTILSSLAETSKRTNIEEVTVVATSPENKELVSSVAERINHALGTQLKINYECIEGDPEKDIPRLCQRTAWDCAIISLPDHLHFSFTRELINNKVHCLMVKPFTPTLAEGRELVQLLSARNLYGAVEFHKRFDETNLFIKKTLAAGELGKLLYCTVDYSQKVTIPVEVFSNWSDRTNIFQYLGVHYVDLLHFLTGFIPTRCMAVGTDGLLKSQGINTYDSVHANIVWINPSNEHDTFFSQHSTNWIDPACTSAMSDQKYKIIGTRGRVECDQKNRGVELVCAGRGIQQINPYFSEYLPDPDGRMRFSGYGHTSIDLFVRDVKGLIEGTHSVGELDVCRPTFRQALASTAVIDAANKSLMDNFSWKVIDDVL